MITTERVTLEILGNKVTATAEEMAITLQRTGRTIYVKESADFGVGLVTREGEMFGHPRHLGVYAFFGLNAKRTLDSFSSIEPGDVFITNHPYKSGGLATHLPDIHLIRPYFVDGELVCFGWSFVHSADIGGKVPSSISPTSKEVFEEGMLIPPMKLLRRDEWNDDVLQLYMANCRTPQMNRGDILAMLAALDVGERRVKEIVAEFGLEVFRTAQEDLLRYSEEGTRRALSTLPNGTYTFWDYMDDGSVDNAPLRVRVALTLEDGSACIDFSGTDAEAGGPLNIPTEGGVNPWLALRIASLAHTIAPHIPANAGMMRPISVKTELGSIVHPAFPAPVGIRSATGLRVIDAVSGALSIAAPDIMPACPSGTGLPMVLVEPGVSVDEAKVSVIQFMVGGLGARDGADGIDGRDPGLSSMANSPIEVVEREASVRFLEYGLVQDGGGAGTFRGGCGQLVIFEATRDGCSMLARGMERMRFSPWGRNGGLPGGRLSIVLRRQGGAREVLHKFETLRLDRGDIVEVRMPGGGGFGPAHERPIDLVLRDVRRGAVSIEAAERDYGIVIRDGEVDRASTDALRERLRAGSMPDIFSFGRERQLWEQFFSDEMQMEVSHALRPLSRPMRERMRERLYRPLAPKLMQASARGETLDELLTEADAVAFANEVRAIAATGPRD